MSFFLGNLAIMYNHNIVLDIMNTDNSVIVFSLDEDNDKPEFDPEINHRVVMGTILLPTVEALWSLSSGDFDKFQLEYYQHLNNPDVTEFIFMMIGMMYRGYKLILYYPDDSSEAIQYMLAFFMSNFGLHVCDPTKQYDLFSYDQTKVPMYACGIYYAGIISPNEFLYLYPNELDIPYDIYPKLIYDLSPYGSNMEEKIKVIDCLRKSIKERKNINVKLPFVPQD